MDYLKPSIHHTLTSTCHIIKHCHPTTNQPTYLIHTSHPRPSLTPPPPCLTPPPLYVPQVPLYPDASAAPSFTKSSGMVYFGLPTRNGQLVDKWRVEWSTDSSFSPFATHQAVLLLPQVS